VFLEIYRQFKKANVGMLVMQQAEWFTTACLVAEHVSGGHFVGTIVHCEQAWRLPFVATMITGGPSRAGGSSSLSEMITIGCDIRIYLHLLSCEFFASSSGPVVFAAKYRGVWSIIRETTKCLMNNWAV
jgi:hypothetical protein